MSHLNIKTLLNLKEKFKGFVFKNSKIIFKDNEHRIEVVVRPRKAAKGNVHNVALRGRPMTISHSENSFMFPFGASLFICFIQ